MMLHINSTHQHPGLRRHGTSPCHVSSLVHPVRSPGAAPLNSLCDAKRHVRDAADHHTRARRRRPAWVLAACAADSLPLEQQLAEMVVEHETDMGHVTIRAVEAKDSLGACVVLCRAFAGSPEEISLTDAKKYVDTVVSNPPNGVLFVARIKPKDLSLLPPNQDSRLIGTVALSLHEDTLQAIPTLPPPPNTAYLSNMAVDNQFRRRGVAKALLRICDQAAKAAGLKEIYLHVRQGDDAALKLYTGDGYQEESRDSFLSAKLKNVRPRILLKKDV